MVIPTYNRKSKLMRLLKSIAENDYSNLEIIVVDDNSTDGTAEEVKKIKNVTLIRNDRELLLAASRNIGIKRSNGDYVLIVDDDNILSKELIQKLLEGFNSKTEPPIGIMAPMMFYFKERSRIWCCGIKIGMISSLTKIIGRDEINVGQYTKLIESQGFPNAFMIKREVFDRVGLFDEKTFPIHYDEADFGERVRKHYKIVCNPQAKIWHDISLPHKIKNKARSLHCYNKIRAYYCGRNRILFHRRHSKKWQFTLFVLFFNWFFAIYYIEVILFGSKKVLRERLKIASYYVKGVLDGLTGVTKSV